MTTFTGAQRLASAKLYALQRGWNWDTLLEDKQQHCITCATNILDKAQSMAVRQGGGGEMSANRATLRPGAFYWVIPANDPDSEEEWEMAAQPARWIGPEGDYGERWHCLNIEGPSDWPMKWVGPEIVEIDK